jgi:hypothetical protein
MPVQDFGNAFSTFIAQNYGAGKQERIRKGLKGAVLVSVVFCVIVSALVFVFAKPLMLLFVEAGETEIIAEGVRYLHIEGAFYCGIGCLFLLYGLYRAVAKPRYERGADGHLARYARGAGISFIRYHRCYRHLVVGADRLVPRGCYRRGVLLHS